MLSFCLELRVQAASLLLIAHRLPTTGRRSCRANADMALLSLAA